MRAAIAARDPHLRPRLQHGGRGPSLPRTGASPRRVAVVDLRQCRTPAASPCARELGIETAVVPRKSFADRAAFERGDRRADRGTPTRSIIVLAGFMRVLSPGIHPSLRRAALQHSSRAAAEASRAAHARPCARSGGRRAWGQRALRHGGTGWRPGRSAVENGCCDLQKLKTNWRPGCSKTEHVILPKVIGWLADRRLTWRDGKGWLDGQPLDAPVVEDFDAVKGH